MEKSLYNYSFEKEALSIDPSSSFVFSVSIEIFGLIDGSERKKILKHLNASRSMNHCQEFLIVNLIFCIFLTDNYIWFLPLAQLSFGLII